MNILNTAYCISSASRIKRILHDNHERFVSEWPQKTRYAYMQIFQIYQCRMLGVCFYRSVHSDESLLKELAEGKKERKPSKLFSRDALLGYAIAIIVLVPATIHIVLNN